MRDLTTERLRIGLSALKESDGLRPGFSGRWSWTNGARVGVKTGVDSLTLHYVTKHDEKSHSDRIGLTRLPCNYGGHRTYFLCPCCKRRCLDLYGSAPFACRRCHQLAYNSETAKGAFRQYDTGQKIAHRLAGRFVTLDEPFPERPAGMHRKTYRRLMSEWERKTGPARMIMDGMWQDDDFLRECIANASFVRAEREARERRVLDFHKRYWADKATPASWEVGR